jgi:TonB-linked SusC/RagA family outer membrane protein
MGRTFRRICGLAYALAAFSAAEAQEPGATGTITGRVTDRATGQPVPDAQLSIVGTTRGARTNETGAYRITAVPPGLARVRVLRIGFESVTDSVTVPAGGTATLDFPLAVAATRLDQIVVTATGESLRRRETGSAASAIAVDSVDKTATADLTDLLSSRASSVVVTQTSGTTGGGSRIRIRGSNSVSLSNEPLILIDGVRATADVLGSSLDIGGQNPSRLDDLNPEDIESMEVIKGPAGVALYGTAAANGVIQIRTKRGQSGRTKWTSYAEGGTVREVTDFPANYAQVGIRPSGNRTTGCTLDQQSDGLCTATPDSLLSFNPLEQASPFVNGSRQAYGLSVAGGGNVATYYVSGDYDREQGVYPNNAARRTSLRANISGKLRDDLDLTVNSGYVQSRLQLPQNDNNDLGPLGNGLLGFAVDNSTHGYLGFGPDISNAIITRQDGDRFTGSLNANWRPLSWLSTVGVVGLDYLSRDDNQILPPNLIEAPDRRSLGSRTSNPYSLWTYTANGSATATYGLTSALKSTSTAGLQYTKELIKGTQAFGRGLAAGTGSLSGTTSDFAVFEQNSNIVTVGAFAQEQLAWGDRLFLTGALRGDDNSTFGQDFKFVYYPSVNLSWVVNEEGFFPQNRWVNTLRLRTAYGQSGQRPGFRNALTFYNAVGVRRGESDVGGVAIGDTVGNAVLKPERSAEYELGADAGFFGGRLGVDLTYYNKDTRDALILRLLPPSAGALSRFENLGRVTNKGFEATVNATLLDLRAAKWDATITGATNSNRLVTLGEGVDTIFFGLGANDGNSVQRFVEGKPMGGYWQRPLLGYSDANDDGIIQPDEVQLGESSVYLGNPIPKTEVSINTGVTFFQYFRVSGVLNHRGGFSVYNSTQQFRCAVIARCREAYDPTAPLPQQAARIASLVGSDAGYIEDGSFWKLRELAFTLSAPQQLADRLRTSGLSLTVAGRNLATWSDYTGFDPEVNFNGTSNFSTADFLTQPPVRYWTARINASW